MLEGFRGEEGFLESAVVLPHHRVDRIPCDGESAPLIAEDAPPSARPENDTRIGAVEGDGTGSADHDKPRLPGKGRPERYPGVRFNDDVLQGKFLLQPDGKNRVDELGPVRSPPRDSCRRDRKSTRL